MDAQANQNTSNDARRALLGNFTPGHIVPKDNMERQWHRLKESAEFGWLSSDHRLTLEKLLLGPFRRGLYTEPPQP
ncbi:hypothetical protein ABBQ38_008911 [Trebouxia sp. C0009 RCD-2024]